MNTSTVALGVAVIALILGGLAMTKGSPIAPIVEFGGQFYEQNHKTFFEGLTALDQNAINGLTETGGVVTVTPTSEAVTLTQEQLLSGNVITFAASTTQAALTVTLPATSTMTTLLPNAGDMRRWVIENPFTAAATTTTIAAGTGIDLQETDGLNVVIGINNYAFVTCFREASTDVVCAINETIPAD
jgi:hypothetical protein